MENGAKSATNEKKAKERKPHNPNILSSLFIWWMCPVFITGNKRDLEEDDLIVPTKKYEAEQLGEYFERYWFEECERATKENRKPSLWKAMRRAYLLAYMPGAFFVVTGAVCRTVQPMLFAELLSYWSVDSNMTRYDAGFYALAMLGLNFVALMCQHHNSLFVARFGMRIKVATSSVIFRKLLRMSQVASGDIAGGKLVNLLSNDVARFDYAFMFLHNLWVIPIQAAVVLYFLYVAAGYAPFIGLFSVVFMILPVQAALTKLTATIRRDVAQKTDRRIKLMSEIINGIQVIKMYAWEKPFQLVVKAARALEMRALRKSIFVRSVFLGFMLFTERTTLFVTTLTLVLTGNIITATLIYPIQQYFSIIQLNITMILPLAIASFSEMLVSLERVQGFLEMEEREDLARMPISNGIINRVTFNSKEYKNNETDLVMPQSYSKKDNFTRTQSIEQNQRRESLAGQYAIELNRISASWTTSTDPADLTLRNISLRLGAGKLCAIIGPVGSGKSSILQAILKELPLCEGNVNIKGRISYACQESWLFPDTVRENILFGLPYDVRKYQEVCKTCCLLPDFKQFPYGDLSLVGERGVSLSGGQRARINLARAIYREADIYLLDDPLSAVDANVGRQLFDGCIRGYLKDRTCILVTHQIHYVKAADVIVVLNDGRIENIGTYDELIESGKEFSKLLSNQDSDKDDNDASGGKRPSIHRGISKISTKSGDTPEDEKAQVLTSEERAKGNLKWEVLYKYLTSVGSWFIVFLAFLTLLITQASATMADYWLSYWTNQVDQYEQSLGGEEPDSSLGIVMGSLTTGQYLIVYGSVILGLIVISHVRIINFVIMTMRASENLHNTVYKKLIISVMRFFDTNPSGRVLNRFSKDFGAMDEFLPRSILETVQMYLSMTSILVLNAIALPWTLIPTVILIIIFVFLLKWYLNAAQAVKRLEGTTKSPVFGMINSTLSGLSTIRSSNSQNRLLNMFDNAQNLHTSAFYTFVGGSSGFGLYLDALCLVYLGIIFAIFLVIDFSTIIPVGSVGLAVSQSMILTMMLQLAARFTADFLGQMTAVERVLEYTHLPTEDNMDDGPIKPAENWPPKGKIEFRNVFLNYGPEDPPVLKNLNFEIQEGWKVGVVGRTGAGKSSLISALFRLYNIQGSITIDGLDTDGIAKARLRSKISIIPQEPVLFSATLRYNLDPFNSYSDDEIWRALEQVELKEVVPALDYKVTEGGSNFSMGQRQLVCLARAILRSNKILVMDEATANVDPQTDTLIQKTIRRQFATCTVITIAHRLNTIMDSDRVLVMDKGTVVEFDHPHILLSDPNSKFSSMVRETGESMTRVLKDVAKNKYLSDYPDAEK
ncbi:LOW QUALITY PROTEIN: multidrug resistance-associated protein 4 [Manduca sexta]|uniref:LOW QUALITY PROTEIN: multidrug resistance-associated protein 4 n=1 Tax=Manduca sexta TaxID=7130 RepID=UPI00188F9CA6|nr:LOW QUALITY PROTEIN: multidrug resistance-associated protein 4 [Manduca sexta]